MTNEVHLTAVTLASKSRNDTLKSPSTAYFNSCQSVMVRWIAFKRTFLSQSNTSGSQGI